MDEPPVEVYMQRYDAPQPDRLETSGEWRGERSWPPEGCERARTVSGRTGIAWLKPPGGAAPDSLTTTRRSA